VTRGLTEKSKERPHTYLPIQSRGGTFSAPNAILQASFHGVNTASVAQPVTGRTLPGMAVLPERLRGRTVPQVNTHPVIPIRSIIARFSCVLHPGDETSLGFVVEGKQEKCTPMALGGPRDIHPKAEPWSHFTWRPFLVFHVWSSSVRISVTTRTRSAKAVNNAGPNITSGLRGLVTYNARPGSELLGSY